MPQKIRSARMGIALAVATLALASCAGKQESYRPQASAKKPASVSVTPRSPEALWNLRSGLNVAALTCRGRGMKSVSGAYRRMLSRHRVVLKAAYDYGTRRYGVSGFDKRQTRLYNRFANQRSPQRFCKAAASIASKANSMDSQALGSAAPRLYGELRSNLR